MRAIIFSCVGTLLAGFFAGSFCAPDQQKPRNESPLTYRDEKTGIIFYVESDRRHVAAIDKDGKLLWAKIPEEMVTEVLADRPLRITYIGKLNDWMLQATKDQGRKSNYVAISLSNKEFGTVDQTNGVYRRMGSD